MKLKMERVHKDGKTIGWAVDMTCKNEAEFRKIFNKISNVNGVEWCGCPTEEDSFYWDQIAYIPKKGMTVAELQDEARRIVKECKRALRQK